jgi:hypothetical protein
MNCLALVPETAGWSFILLRSQRFKAVDPKPFGTTPLCELPMSIRPWGFSVGLPSVLLNFLFMADALGTTA